MAKPKKLKVYRTAIGFHDAYVAAPTKKAALEAWGTETNLFARGAAEEVADAKLVKAPLARPGEVVKVLRGSEAEQIRALGAQRKAPAKGKRRATEGSVEEKETGAKGKARGGKPSRAGVEKAEAALERAGEKQRSALAALAADAAAIERRRRALEAKQRAERERLEQKLEQARAAYAAAMAEWAGD